MRALPFTVVALAACHGTDQVAPDGVAANCGDNAPVVADLVVEESEPFTIGDEQVPGIFLNTVVTDADGDLHWYELRLYWDDQVDGTVATDGFYYEAYGARGDLDCGVEQTEVAVRIAASGAPPAGRTVEFGVVVYDDMEHASGDGAPFVVEFDVPE